MSLIRPWPYAAKAVIQFRFTVNRLELWITFRHPMNEDLLPPLSAFVFKLDGVDKIANVAEWRSPYTLALSIPNILANPARVLSTYLGPRNDLVTTWGKQWEPWDRIICIDVPYGWEHILEVDVDNARVTVNGTLLLTHKTVLRGTYNDLDVDGVNILFLNSTTGDIIINGFSNGVPDQVLFIAITTPTANDITLAHENGAGDQEIHLHAGVDETLTNQYGGWNLVCLGTHWYDISHAKHV